MEALATARQVLLHGGEGGDGIQGNVSRVVESATLGVLGTWAPSLPQLPGPKPFVAERYAGETLASVFKSRSSDIADWLAGLPGTAAECSPAWNAGFEAMELVDAIVEADRGMPGARTLEQAQLRQLRHLAAAGTDAGAPTLRAALLRRLAQRLRLVRERIDAGQAGEGFADCVSAAERVIDAVVPNEASATPKPSQLSVQAAGEIFDAGVDVAGAVGRVVPNLAGPLCWAFRAATPPSRLQRKPQLRILMLLRLLDNDLLGGRCFNGPAHEGFFQLLCRILRCGVLSGGGDDDVEASTIAVRCLARLSAFSDVDDEDQALDAIVLSAVEGVATCVSVDGIVASWLQAQRLRNTSTFDGSLPAASVTGASGGAARRRNARAARGGVAGAEAPVLRSWRRVLDVDANEEHMRNQFDLSRCHHPRLSPSQGRSRSVQPPVPPPGAAPGRKFLVSCRGFPHIPVGSQG
eukprot:TRINITY_DN45838_c0_g1_i1.p1 TRINITY_DN45838_c0_g1~~TRINITY_DN45838_c0_g1_i1.p1  ORF type:complete len:465 (+),score=57.13 TRINITY_DN45838_c0_g1_i1:36-1430(+)